MFKQNFAKQGGFLGIIGDLFFGGAEKKAGDMQAKAAMRAARLQRRTTRDVVKLVEKQGEQGRSDLEPQRQTGYQALSKLANLLGLPGQAPGDYASYVKNSPDLLEAFKKDNGGLSIEEWGKRHYDTHGNAEGRELPTMYDAGEFQDFEKTPGYQFQLDEMTSALDKKHAAAGSYGSGAQMRELARYSGGLAAQEYGNYFDRLKTLAGFGNAATSQTANIGAQTATNVGNAMMTGTDRYSQALMDASTARASGVLGQSSAVKGTLEDILKTIIGTGGGIAPGGGGGGI